jgi:hypothetical protein
MEKNDKCICVCMVCVLGVNPQDEAILRLSLTMGLYPSLQLENKYIEGF